MRNIFTLTLLCISLFAYGQQAANNFSNHYLDELFVKLSTGFSYADSRGVLADVTHFENQLGIWNLRATYEADKDSSMNITSSNFDLDQPFGNVGFRSIFTLSVMKKLKDGSFEMGLNLGSSRFKGTKGMFFSTTGKWNIGSTFIPAIDRAKNYYVQDFNWDIFVGYDLGLDTGFKVSFDDTDIEKDIISYFLQDGVAQHDLPVDAAQAYAEELTEMIKYQSNNNLGGTIFFISAFIGMEGSYRLTEYISLFAHVKYTDEVSRYIVPRETKRRQDNFIGEIGFQVRMFNYTRKGRK